MRILPIKESREYFAATGVGRNSAFFLDTRSEFCREWQAESSKSRGIRLSLNASSRNLCLRTESRAQRWRLMEK